MWQMDIATYLLLPLLLQLLADHSLVWGLQHRSYFSYKVSAIIPKLDENLCDCLLIIHVYLLPTS